MLCIFILYLYKNTITMNQIIKTPNNSMVNNSEKQKPSHISKNRIKLVYFFKFYFVISILIILCSLLYYFNNLYKINKNEKLSEVLVNNYNISRLYSDLSSETLSVENKNSFSIIGILVIDKISLKYPILSKLNNTLLQIAPCKFYGPNFGEFRKYMHSRA